MAQITIEVTGMSCNGCEQSVEIAFGKLPGISSVNADHSTGKVQIEYNEEPPDNETLADELKRIGYTLVS